MKTRTGLLLTVLIAVIFISVSCKEEEENYPVVTTAAVTSVTDSSAVCGGRVVSDGGSNIVERGVLFSAEGILYYDWSMKTTDGTGTGVFISYMESLDPGTKYYVQAYAKNRTGLGYGEILEFTTTDK